MWNKKDFSSILKDFQLSKIVSDLKVRLEGSKIGRAKFFRKILILEGFLAFAKNLIKWCFFFYPKNGA